jgi:hypothetical protein
MSDFQPFCGWAEKKVCLTGWDTFCTPKNECFLYPIAIYVVLIAIYEEPSLSSQDRG